MLKRIYSEDTFNFEELDVHNLNGIEHGASLTRLDTALQPNQSVKHVPFIEYLVSFATGKYAGGKTLLTKRDMARMLGKRRPEANEPLPQALCRCQVCRSLLPFIALVYDERGPRSFVHDAYHLSSW
ncbi:hypothetical protein OG21DRAFT_1488031 [Imleria badia]|nr:hypothetical protein OG21DRAFT_1488031 [Imleria badia]